jgi:hypothetical protein
VCIVRRGDTTSAWGRWDPDWPTQQQSGLSKFRWPVRRHSADDCTGDKLEIDVIFLHKLFACRRALIVQLLELGFESSVGEVLVQFGVSSQEFTFSAVFDGFGQDSGGVVVVNDHDVFIAFAGCDRKTTSLVRINLSRYRHNFGIH